MAGKTCILCNRITEGIYLYSYLNEDGVRKHMKIPLCEYCVLKRLNKGLLHGRRRPLF